MTSGVATAPRKREERADRERAAEERERRKRGKKERECFEGGFYIGVYSNFSKTWLLINKSWFVVKNKYSLIYVVSLCNFHQ